MPRCGASRWLLVSFEWESIAVLGVWSFGIFNKSYEKYRLSVFSLDRSDFFPHLAKNIGGGGGDAAEVVGADV